MSREKKQDARLPFAVIAVIIIFFFCLHNQPHFQLISIVIEAVVGLWVRSIRVSVFKDLANPPILSAGRKKIVPGYLPPLP